MPQLRDETDRGIVVQKGTAHLRERTLWESDRLGSMAGLQSLQSAFLQSPKKLEKACMFEWNMGTALAPMGQGESDR